MFYFVILSAIAAILASPVQELDSSSIDFHTLGSTDNGLFSNFNTDNDSLDRVDSESYVPESDFTASPNDSLIADSFGCNTRKLRARDDIDGETVANELPNACSIHMQRVSPDSVKAPSKEGSGNIEPAGQLEPYKPARLAPTTADSERKCRDESFHLGVCCIGLRGGVLKLEPYKKWYFLQVEGCVADWTECPADINDYCCKIYILDEKLGMACVWRTLPMVWEKADYWDKHRN